MKNENTMLVKGRLRQAACLGLGAMGGGIGTLFLVLSWQLGS